MNEKQRMAMNEDTKNKIAVSLSAIDPVLQNNVPEYIEEKVRGKEYISYGKNNLFPNYL